MSIETMLKKEHKKLSNQIQKTQNLLNDIERMMLERKIIPTSNDNHRKPDLMKRLEDQESRIA